MTVVISSSILVELVNGVGVQINTPVVPIYTTDDIYNASNPSQTLTQEIAAISSTQLFGTVTNIDGTTVAGVYPMFTVPSAQKLYVTAIYFVLTAITGSGTVPALSVGFTGPDYRDIIDGITNSTMFSSPVEITTVGQILPVTSFPTLAGGSGADYAAIGTGNQISIYVNSAATYSSYKLTCFGFGFLSS